MIMERKWYKIVNGVLTEAPDNLETATGTMFNFNAESNEQILREYGYLPENEIDYEITQIIQPTLEERVADIEQVTTEVITALNDKGIVP